MRVTGLTKTFGRVHAVDGIDLEIPAGQVFSLLGPSGCGKTTTLRVIAGLEEPDAGEITFGDRPIVSMSQNIVVPTHKRNLGMVFQSYAIWPHMTVFDNVAYPLRARNVPSQQRKERVLKMLELVGLGDLHARHATQLSGGQQQRVALARALVHEPGIILLDEPFSNLDAQLREQMRIQLKILLKSLGITAIFVTHDQSEALSLSDQMAVMSAGRIEQVGAPRDLYEHPASPFVRDFLGKTVTLRGVIGERGAVALEGSDAIIVRSVPQGLDGLTTGANVTVAIRPEDVLVTDSPDQTEASLRARAEAVLFVGGYCECRVVLDNGDAIEINSPRSQPVSEGQIIWLVVKPSAVSIWPR